MRKLETKIVKWGYDGTNFVKELWKYSNNWTMIAGNSERGTMRTKWTEMRLDFNSFEMRWPTLGFYHMSCSFSVRTPNTVLFSNSRGWTGLVGRQGLWATKSEEWPDSRGRCFIAKACSALLVKTVVALPIIGYTMHQLRRKQVDQLRKNSSIPLFNICTLVSEHWFACLIFRNIVI